MIRSDAPRARGWAGAPVEVERSDPKAVMFTPAPIAGEVAFRSEADLTVVWRGVVVALEHPRLGLIGPVPLRRTGGHTGRYGLAYLRAPGVAAVDGGVRLAFDVVPTLVALLGEKSTTAGRTVRAFAPAHPSGTFPHMLHGSSAFLNCDPARRRKRPSSFP